MTGASGRSSAQRLQESAHGEDFDYRAGSPHLKHWRLKSALVGLLHEALRDVRARGLPLTLLEVGAGHGGLTEHALAMGFEVTATEMSRPSLERLTKSFGANAQFTSVFDPDGSLGVLGDQTFAVVLCASVLHHIPDYLAFVGETCDHRVLPGGSLLTIQDPLRYDRVPRRVRLASETSYFLWRLCRGQIARGVATRIRRLRGILDESNPADMVEYHVVRNGVDEAALERLLESRFSSVSLLRYWSTQATPLQRLGERTAMSNSFALFARDRDEPKRER